MPYICKQCANKTYFEENASGTCSFDSILYLNQHGEEHDTDYDYDNHEIDSTDNVECSGCGSQEIEDVSQETWDAWTGPEEDDEEPTPVTNWKDRMEAQK